MHGRSAAPAMPGKSDNFFLSGRKTIHYMYFIPNISAIDGHIKTNGDSKYNHVIRRRRKLMNVGQNKLTYLRDNSKLSSLTATGKSPSKITKGNRSINLRKE